MAYLRYSDVDEVIKSLKQSINCNQYSTEIQLVWLIELIVATEFKKNPHIVPDYSSKNYRYNVETSLVCLDDYYARLWEKLVAFRNYFCHVGVMLAVFSKDYLEKNSDVIIALAHEYGVVIDLTKYKI